MAEIAIGITQIALAATIFVADQTISSLENKGHDTQNMKADIRGLKDSLEILVAYVKHKEGYKSNEIVKAEVKQARELAYDIEDVLYQLILHAPRDFQASKIVRKGYEAAHDVRHSKSVRDISEEIKTLKVNLDSYLRLRNAFTVTSNFEVGSSSRTSGVHTAYLPSLKKDEMVGYEREMKTLLDSLAEKNSTHVMILVFGPTGSGKSMLVSNVYQMQSIQEMFDCRAWVHLSRSFQVNEIFSNILMQFSGRNIQRADAHVALNTYVQDKRFMVVLDSVWSRDDLSRIVNALSIGSRGSKIVVTARDENITPSRLESLNRTIKLNGLTGKQSWKLFCTKAFGTGRDCPAELLELSEQIVERCNNLPFAISEIGSLLSKKSESPIEWKKLLDSLQSDIQANSSSIVNRFLQSLTDLPGAQKSCFLYFSIFPQDSPISRGRLIRSWVAEGFPQARTTPGSRTREVVAEDYLNELVQKNLVSVSAREIDGRVKSCHVLNLVHGFIVSEAYENNFVSILATQNATADEITRRVSVQNGRTNLPTGRAMEKVRTCFIFSRENMSDSKILEILRRFRLLRVLDLQAQPLEKFPKEILDLRLLKSLNLSYTNIRKIPRSIKNLVFLETLDLRQTLVKCLPSTIFRLRKLCNLFVYRRNDQSDSKQGVKLSHGIGALRLMQKLTLVKVNGQRKLIMELENLTELRKLGLVDIERKYGINLCISIEKLVNLSTLKLQASMEDEYLELDNMQRPPQFLRKLYLDGRLLERLPVWISSLHSLVKIGLKRSRLHKRNNPLEILQELPNLMSLEMVDYYLGEKLEFKAGTFKKLKVLHIENFTELNLVVMEKKTMGMLEKLIISKCNNLKMLPLGIEFLFSLNELCLPAMPRELLERMNGEDHRMVARIRTIY